MLSKRMEEALNAQINAEFWSAYLYLSMAMHFENAGYKGVANWFAVQFKEEQDHATIFMNYVNARRQGNTAPHRRCRYKLGLDTTRLRENPRTRESSIIAHQQPLHNSLGRKRLRITKYAQVVYRRASRRRRNSTRLHRRAKENR